MLDRIVSLARGLAGSVAGGPDAGQSPAPVDGAREKRDEEGEEKAEGEVVEMPRPLLAAVLPAAEPEQLPDEVAQEEPHLQKAKEPQEAQQIHGPQDERQELDQGFTLSPELARRQELAAQRAASIEARMEQNRAKRLGQSRDAEVVQPEKGVS